MINLAILGTNFGKYHAQLYKGIKDANVEIIFGRNEKKLAEIENELGIKTSTSLADIIANNKIDLVDICLPSELHKEYAIKCLESGKHVFCETPVTFSSQDALEIQAAAKRNKKMVFVDQFIKFSQPHRYAIDFVRNVKKKTPNVFTCYNKTPPIWGDLSIQKSLFMFFIHNMDFLVEIMGCPSGIVAQGFDQKEKSTIFSGYQYQDGIASVACFSNLPIDSPFQIGYELVFDDCILSFSGSYGNKTEEQISLFEGAHKKPVSLEPKNYHEEALRHVIDCLGRNEKSNLIDIEIALESIRLIEQTKVVIGKNTTTASV